MSGAIPPFPQYDFMAWCSKHRDNFPLNVLPDTLHILKVPGSILSTEAGSLEIFALLLGSSWGIQS
jgi:hypothetical protein